MEVPRLVKQIPMASPLPLRPVPKDRETLPSFLSRLAAMNGGSAADFAYDMGFSVKRIFLLEERALARLTAIGGLERADIDEMISWTGQAIGDVRMQFRGEVFGSRALRNPVVRGCPVCLLEDIAEQPRDPRASMAMRGDWLLREASLCCRHQHLLVPLWTAAHQAGRLDIAVNMPDLTDRLRAGVFNRPLKAPSAYDLWLDRRLETGADDTGLAGYGLYAASTICGLLGAEMLRVQGRPGASGADRAAAQAEGFAILDQGDAAFRAALERLAETTSGRQSTPRQAFGGLYTALADYYLNDEAFARFRKVMRDCILETWPVAAGEVVLGEMVPARRLHSLKTASQETGLGTSVIEAFLTDAGAFPPDDARPPARKTFDARAHADLLAELPTLVGPLEMQAAIGATRAQLRALEADGVLRPRTDRPKIKSPWRISDGLALIAELNALVVVTPQAEATTWEALPMAPRRSGLRVGAIIGAVRRGDLRLACDPNIFGYRSFLVDKAGIDRMRQEERSRRYKDRPQPSGMNAAAFGRSVGLRDKGRFLALVAAGHTPATSVPHAGHGAPIPYVTDHDIAAFHYRFLTPSSAEREFGLHRRTCLTLLNRAGVRPFAPNGEDYGLLFERERAEPVLLRDRSRERH